MPKESKVATVAAIKEKFIGSGGVIMADYRGLTVKEMQELRARLRESGGEMKIYKNTLTEIAVRELALPSMDAFLTGPTAFVFTPADPVGSAKVLADFSVGHPALQIKGGFVQNAIIDAASVKAIAALPSRNELIAKLMGTMLNPVRNFMSMANGPASAFTRVIKAIADQKAAA